MKLKKALTLRETKRGTFLMKGKKLPDGTIRNWKGGKYKKVNGKWMPHIEGKGGGEKKAVKEKEEKGSSEKMKVYKMPATELKELNDFFIYRIKELGANNHRAFDDFMEQATKGNVEGLPKGISPKQAAASVIASMQAEVGDKGSKKYQSFLQEASKELKNNKSESDLFNIKVAVVNLVRSAFAKKVIPKKVPKAAASTPYKRHISDTLWDYMESGTHGQAKLQEALRDPNSSGMADFKSDVEEYIYTETGKDVEIPEDTLTAFLQQNADYFKDETEEED